jgi:hypothetical protein
VISVEAVAQHRDSVLGFDMVDLIQSLAGLQLVAANAGRLLRLEGGVQSLASIETNSAAGRPITGSQLRGWLNESPFQVPEDPFNNSFLEEVTFVGGSYRVFPGAVEGASFLFRRLAAAIFKSGEWPPGDPFRRDAMALATAGLRVSDAVARRAGVARGTRPGLGALVLPQQRELERLKQAVAFTENEWGDLLDGLSDDAAAPLTQELGLPLTSNREHLGTGPFYARPLLRYEGGIIVGLPHAVLGAVLHALVSLAIKHGMVERLAIAFRSAVFHSVLQSLEFIECPRLHPPLSDPPEGFADAVLSLDRDKFRSTSPKKFRSNFVDEIPGKVSVYRSRCAKQFLRVRRSTSGRASLRPRPSRTVLGSLCR